MFLCCFLSCAKWFIHNKDLREQPDLTWMYCCPVLLGVLPVYVERRCNEEDNKWTMVTHHLCSGHWWSGFWRYSHETSNSHRKHYSCPQEAGQLCQNHLHFLLCSRLWEINVTHLVFCACHRLYRSLFDLCIVLTDYFVYMQNLLSNF